MTAIPLATAALSAVAEIARAAKVDPEVRKALLTARQPGRTARDVSRHADAWLRHTQRADGHAADAARWVTLSRERGANTPLMERKTARSLDSERSQRKRARLELLSLALLIDESETAMAEMLTALLESA